MGLRHNLIFRNDLSEKRVAISNGIRAKKTSAVHYRLAQGERSFFKLNSIAASPDIS
jgi:hypothetical protein